MELQVTKVLVPAKVRGPRGDEREEEDEESQEPAETAGHQAGPGSEVEPVAGLDITPDINILPQ